MATTTISKSVTKGEDLVVISRKEYEALLRVKTGKGSYVVVKRSKSFRVPKRHEKFYNELDKRLTIALREVEEGKVVGPFDNADDAIKFLRSREKSK